MQKISQSICLIAFLVLVATTCMAETIVNQAKADDHPHHLLKKLDSTYCTTATMHDYACHDRCHNTTIYIHDCETYNGNCDEVSTHLDICNSTYCHNTTRTIHACYSNVADNCGDTDTIYRSCTNGDCRNHTTHAHACYDTSMEDVTAMNFVTSCLTAGADIVDPIARAILDAICIDGLITAVRRRFGSSQ